MTVGDRRGVTRGYVVGLTGATAILSLALLVAAWGGLSLVTGVAPVQTVGVPFGVAPLLILLVVALLTALVWNIAIALLRARRQPPLAELVLSGVGAYLIWSLGGMLAGLSINETWLSPYAAALGVIWVLMPLGFWAVLTRRIYTDRPPPRWPWEKHPAPDDLQYPDHPVYPEDTPTEPDRQ